MFNVAAVTRSAGSVAFPLRSGFFFGRRVLREIYLPVYFQRIPVYYTAEYIQEEDARIALCVSGIVARQGCGIGAIFARIDMCI